MKIFIVGSGKLSKAIAGLSFEPNEIVKWENSSQALNEKAICVHAGSGRQLNECFEFCERTKSVLIELSTGLGTDKLNPGFPLIICPNTSLLVLKTLNMMKAKGSYFENYNITITESHQSTKKTEPGTAYAFAKALNFSPAKIISVRDPEIQKTEIGIPADFIDRHAYHKITINDGNDELTIETKVFGHNSYASGVKAILETIVKQNLENRRYSIFELIESNLL